MQGQRRELAGQHGRLSIIAPKQENEAAQPSAAIPNLTPISGEVKRNRLPPRSRSGCWTCRTRKVKCDELRPACGQCVRLDHICDYNPRLAFRDDTPRILERMQQDVSTCGSTIWDPEASASSRDARYSSDNEDLLPPFRSLTTDEEREKKAEAREPGSYYVLANPESFAFLPEYRSEIPASATTPSSQSGLSHSCPKIEDPDIIILKTFEEPGASGKREQAVSSCSRSENLSASPSSYKEIELRRGSYPMVLSNRMHVNHRLMSMLDIAQAGGRDYDLFRHYRTSISSHLTGQQRFGLEEDVFESQARTYPGLYHAMMALSALSLAQKNQIQSADALEHYQKVIPALKETLQSAEDSYSDGAFLCHYVLLLYEIATAGSRESNMSQHHSDQLLRIFMLRRQAQLEEPYEFVVFATFYVDIYALLSTTGSGSFAETLLENNMVPVMGPNSNAFTVNQGHLIKSEEQAYFPALLHLNQEILLLALHVGQTARNLRLKGERIFRSPSQDIDKAEYRLNCRMSVRVLLQTIEATKPSPNVAKINVSRCSREVLHAAGLVLSRVRTEVRFVVLPLFLAGVFTTIQAEKELAMNLISAVEPFCYGGGLQSVRNLLEAIYQKQHAAVLHTGVATSVDWVEELELSGQRLIITGL